MPRGWDFTASSGAAWAPERLGRDDLIRMSREERERLMQEQARLQRTTELQRQLNPTAEEVRMEEMQKAQLETIQLANQKQQDMAQYFEEGYTSQQRQVMAKRENAKRSVLSDPTYSEQEKQYIVSEIDRMNSNEQKSMIPRNPNKKIYPQGQGPGDYWTDDKGNTFGRDRAGEVRQISSAKDTTEYLIAKQKNDDEQKTIQMQHQIKLKQIEAIAKMMGETIEEPDPSGAKNEKGEAKLIQRKLNANEIKERLKIFDEILGNGQQQQPKQQEVPNPAKYLEEIKNKYGNNPANIPPSERARVVAAIRLMKGMSQQ